MEETARDSALSLVGGDQVWHIFPTSMMYPLVPQLRLWERVDNMFSYHSRSMPKGDKHFTVVILWPWGRMGLKRSTRISQGRPQTCNHQHLCPSMASFRAPTNNTDAFISGCLLSPSGACCALGVPAAPPEPQRIAESIYPTGISCGYKLGADVLDAVRLAD